MLYWSSPFWNKKTESYDLKLGKYMLHAMINCWLPLASHIFPADPDIKKTCFFLPRLPWISSARAAATEVASSRALKPKPVPRGATWIWGISWEYHGDIWIWFLDTFRHWTLWAYPETQGSPAHSIPWGKEPLPQFSLWIEKRHVTRQCPPLLLSLVCSIIYIYSYFYIVLWIELWLLIW